MEDWKRDLVGEVQMGVNRSINVDIVINDPKSRIFTDPESMSDLEEDLAFNVLKSDGTVQWIGTKAEIIRMVAEGGIAIIQPDGTTSSGDAKILLQVMNRRYINEFKNKGIKPNKSLFVIGENNLINISSSSTNPRLFVIIERDKNGRLITPVMSPPPGLAVSFSLGGNNFDISNVSDNPYWIEEVMKKADEMGVAIDPFNLQPNQLFLFFAAFAQ
jgi:hypothetical protein